ncbi:site-specific integrase [Methylobacterium radiodurans]|uniref:site-specific integrase n=1 Tax=Methylobacterium radiodurans TaxID=2202828 RepID=UPI0013A5A30A|nr:site-specific integrase [Methylobacterium radiodurans]
MQLSSEAYAVEPNKTERAALASTCRRLQAEAKEWLSGQHNPPKARYDGTLKSLMDLYQVHELSPFHAITAETRRSYVYNLGVLTKRVGARRLDRVTGEDLLRWHREFAKPSKLGGKPRIRFAHALMTMVRIVLKFGKVLNIADARALRSVMDDMEFATAPQREAFIAPEQVEAVRAVAHKRGLPSIALATALMFEAVLRQKDVIGEWVADATADPAGALTDRGRVWGTGLRWGEHVDPRTLIMIKPTSKSRGRRSAEHDLSLMPMVVAELAHVPALKRIGPMIVCETTGRPWRARHFREIWRECAREAGVPDEVWCMDARAGGITEGSDAGADIAHLSKTATHTNTVTTSRYNRDALSKSRKVAELRVLSRRAR